MNEASIRQMFDRAMEKPPSERRAFVERECVGEMRERVLALLAAGEEASGFMAEPAGPLPSSSPSSPTAPSRAAASSSISAASTPRSSRSA